MSVIHGGDIYNNHVKLDFSVNTNPLGIPERVKMAMHEAVEHSSQYPDIRAEELRRAFPSYSKEIRVVRDRVNVHD